MRDVIFANEIRLDVDVVTAFQRFGARGAAGDGWIFAASAPTVRLGAAVELTLPVPDVSTGRNHVRATARIIELSPFRRIVLSHETPWTGRTTVTFSADGSGTIVRAHSELSDDAIRWVRALFGDTGRSTSDADGEVITLGLVTSLSGDSGFVGRAVVNCATLAIGEINGADGIHGRPLDLHVIDDATDPATALARVRAFHRDFPDAALIGMHSSLSLQGLEEFLASTGTLYLYVAPHESEQRTGNLFRLGNSVQAQIDFAVPEVARHTNARRWYLIGNDYSWPREISRAARERIETSGAEVVGETYVPLGAGTSFAPIVDEIIDSGADAIVSSLIGYSSVDFEREFASRDARSRFATLSTLMDEPTLELLGSDADGIWSSLPYFSTLGSPENQSFLRRYNDAFGEWSPPPSVLSAPVYEAVHLFAQAATRAASSSADDIANVIPGLLLGGPRGAIRISSDGSVHSPMFMARAREGKFVVDPEPKTRRARGA